MMQSSKRNGHNGLLQLFTAQHSLTVNEVIPGDLIARQIARGLKEKCTCYTSAVCKVSLLIQQKMYHVVEKKKAGVDTLLPDLTGSSAINKATSATSLCLILIAYVSQTLKQLE